MTTITRSVDERLPLEVPVLALTSRTVLFALAQLLIAGALAASGAPRPWTSSAWWWPLSGTLANLVSIALLAAVIRREGVSLARFLEVKGGAVRRDLGLTLLFLAAAAVLAVLPNLLFAQLLFGDMQAPVAFFIQPIPRWAASVALVAFPATIALAELPTYFAWARPRLLRAGASRTVAWLVPSLFLAVQHVTLPLVLDARFMAWRLLMFLPFALFVGFTLDRRPRLLPWLMACHALLDLSAARLVFVAS